MQYRRNLRARWWLAPLSCAIVSPVAHGAAFLPGSEADPPTGALSSPAPSPVEPPVGDGIQWTLAPWRMRGSLALDLRALRLEDRSTTRQGLLVGDVDLASHIWQPWFVQLRLGMGFVAARSGGDAQAQTQDSGSLTARAAVLVFPASRFPFELRADLSDSRTGGVNLGTEYRSRRLSLSQGWRPAVGNGSLQLQLDHSQLLDSVSTDTLTTFAATAIRQNGAHSIDLAFGYSDNRRSDSEERTRLSNLSARHSFHPATEVQVETLASWNEVRQSAAAFDLGSDVRQVSSFLSWRPRQAPWGGAGAPLVAATARWVQARALDGGRGSTSADAQAFNASLGLSQDLAPSWRASLAASASHVQSAVGSSGDSASLQGGLSWAPAAVPLLGWRYTPTANVNASLARDLLGQDRQTAGLQLAHGVSRDIPWGDSRGLSLAVSQSGAVRRESATVGLSSALSHGASVSWQSMDGAGGQTFGGLSYSDSISHGSAGVAPGTGGARSRFRLINLQLSQRLQFSRYAHGAANLTVQGTHNQSSELDVFTGERREQGQGWQRFYTGSLSYEHQAAFGVPRLRHTVLASLSSQPLERRALGDIDAPRERISESIEARLDYAVGRLDTRLSLRAARVEGRVIAGVQARAQRRF